MSNLGILRITYAEGDILEVAEQRHVGLHRIFGYSSFRPPQAEIIDHLIERR
jgi:superfamily II DNA helicase RecQ